MNANNLQKATLLLAEIHELDRDIISLDKYAMQIADGHKFVNVTIDFETAKKAEPKQVNYYDFMKNTSPFSFLYEESGYKPPEPKDGISLKLTDNECLFVVGALISVKKEHRKMLCAKIIELGVRL